MSQFYCTNCNDYYEIETRSSVCPHEYYVITVDGPGYGWKMAWEAKQAMDKAYRDDDRDAIRIYVGHSNPLVNRYAEQKLKALDLMRDLRDNPKNPEPEDDGDYQLNRVAYKLKKEAEENV